MPFCSSTNGILRNTSEASLPRKRPRCSECGYCSEIWAERSDWWSLSELPGWIDTGTCEYCLDGHEVLGKKWENRFWPLRMLPEVRLELTRSTIWENRPWSLPGAIIGARLCLTTFRDWTHFAIIPWTTTRVSSHTRIRHYARSLRYCYKRSSQRLNTFNILNIICVCWFTWY